MARALVHLQLGQKWHFLGHRLPARLHMKYLPVKGYNNKTSKPWPWLNLQRAESIGATGNNENITPVLLLCWKCKSGGTPTTWGFSRVPWLDTGVSQELGGQGLSQLSPWHGHVQSLLSPRNWDQPWEVHRQVLALMSWDAVKHGGVYAHQSPSHSPLKNHSYYRNW